MGDVYTLLCLLRSAELSKGFGLKKTYAIPKSL